MFFPRSIEDSIDKPGALFANPMSRIPVHSDSFHNFDYPLSSESENRLGLAYDASLKEQLDELNKKYVLLHSQMEELKAANVRLVKTVEMQASVIGDYVKTASKLNNELFTKLCLVREPLIQMYGQPSSQANSVHSTPNSAPQTSQGSSGISQQGITQQNIALQSLPQQGITLQNMAQASIASQGLSSPQNINSLSNIQRFGDMVTTPLGAPFIGLMVRPGHQPPAEEFPASTQESTRKRRRKEPESVEIEESEQESLEKKHKFQPLYVPSKITDNIRDVVTEYLHGVGNGPAIRDLEKMHGPKWRGGAHHPISKKFGRMKPIYDAIERGLQLRFTEEQIIQKLEKAKVYYKDGTKAKRLMTWLQENIPAELRVDGN